MTKSTERSIVALTRQLVRTPSQAYVDSCAPIFGVLEKWMTERADLDFEILESKGERVAILVTVESGVPGPTICLDACVDTAPIGEREAWDRDPFSAVTQGDTIIYGRGSADSKSAVAMFCHLAEQVQREGLLARGSLHVLLDGDEHTGNFAGVKAYLAEPKKRPDFVAIGYPGNDKIVVGSRGFYRAIVKVYGRAAHSGGTKDRISDNAILKMARVLELLGAEHLPQPDDEFPLPPKISVTQIGGGKGFSQIPGSCEAWIDFRLTPSFGRADCERLLQRVIASVDADRPGEQASGWRATESWPPYRLPENHKAVAVMKETAERELGSAIPLVVCGPSNIANYLAANGIAATCGFGARYKNIHAANEHVYIDSLMPVYQAYLASVAAWSQLDAEDFELPSATTARTRRLRLA